MDVFPEFRFAFLEAGAEFAIVLKHRIEENLEQIGYLREMLAHPLGVSGIGPGRISSCVRS